jgi:uncharacterized RDD family membrane protein YckC
MTTHLLKRAFASATRDSRSAIRWLTRTWLAPALLLATAAAPLGRTEAAPLVCADKTMVWIIQRDVPLEGTAKGVRIIHTGTKHWFQPRARFLLRDGDVYCAAVLRGQLNAFFGDGTFYTFERTALGRTVPTASSLLQQRLPGGFLPLAVAGNEAEDALWAVVPSYIAARIIEDNQEQDRFLGGEEEQIVTTLPATQPVVSEPRIDPASNEYWLAAYRPRRWDPIESLGKHVSASVWTAMAFSDGNMALVWRPPPAEGASGGTAGLRYIRHSGEHWSEPETIPNTASLDGLTLGWVKDEPVLVGLRPEPKGGKADVEVLHHQEAGWKSAKLLAADGTPFRVTPDQVGAAVCGDQIFLALVQDASDASWGLWPVGGGKPIENIRPIPDLHVLQAPIVGGRWGQIASYVALVLLLGSVLWRRQDSLLKPANLPAGFAPAGLARRAAGFLLDFTPALVLTAPLLVSAANDALVTHGEQYDVLLQETWLPWLLTRSVYAGYCLAWELWRSVTPGKMATHTIVCGLDGQPCTRGQILIRNLFRIVELELYLLVWPFMLLLVLTRNRQRFGDMWANTLVIQHVPVPPPPRHLDEPGA